MSRDRVRITISLNGELVNQVDSLVDGVRIRNRSHAIETLVSESLELTAVNQAVILAGGENALKRVPIILKMLGQLRQIGIFDIVVAVGYLGERVQKEVGDGVAQGVRIQYSESELGTGGALAHLKPKLKRTFLVVNLDHSLEVDLRNLVKFHANQRPLVTIATRSLKDLSGIYVIEPKLLTQIPSGFCMLEDTVFEQASRNGDLLTYPVRTQ